MPDDINREIYDKLKKMYDEMGWYQPFPSFEEIFSDSTPIPDQIRITIMMQDSENCECKSTKKERKSGKHGKNR